MSLTLAQPESAVKVTAEQMDLITRTVAAGATADELKLYLFDCARQGVHPLDRLVHFTKRSGKYTPITSIDFMRVRAADTGEYAGSDDAKFASVEDLTKPVPIAKLLEPQMPPWAATVTVWRLVQGQRCAFTATARWAEYKPDANDFMWKKMPHTMLAKCAEALALRKGFPRQLAGLYAKEELDQADTEGIQPPTVNEAPPPEPPKPTLAAAVAAVAARVETRDEWRGVLVEAVKATPTKNASVTKYWVHFNNGHDASTIREVVATAAKQARDECVPVNVKTEHGKYGLEILELFVA